jgi:predicted metal-dependent phosphoesterase TrpH
LTLPGGHNRITLLMATIIDLHVHTTKGSSDSSLTPEEMVLEANRLGLPGICITEHNAPWDRHQFADFASKHDLLLIRGVEVDTEMGHVLVFGLDSYVSGISEITGLRRVVKERGGAMVTAHPFRGIHDPRPNSRPYLYRDGRPFPTNVEEGSQHPVFQMVDAVEAANGSTIDSENLFAWEVARRLNLNTTGGSDAHSVHGLGRCTTVFPDDIRSEAEFIDALRNGRYYAGYGLRAGNVQPFKG